MTGSLKAQFNSEGKLDLLDLATPEHNELVPRSKLVGSAQGSPELKQSPNVSKNSKRAQQRQKQQQQQQASQDQLSHAPIPDSTIGHMGTTNGVFIFLEVCCCTST